MIIPSSFNSKVKETFDILPDDIEVTIRTYEPYEVDRIFSSLGVTPLDEFSKYLQGVTSVVLEINGPTFYRNDTKVISILYEPELEVFHNIDNIENV